MLAIGFFVVALIYSAVGFGGGSTYIALLALSDYPAEVVPLIALPCNIAVVSVGSHLASIGEILIGGCPFRFCSLCPYGIGRWLHPLDATVYFLLPGLSLAIAGVFNSAHGTRRYNDLEQRWGWPVSLGEDWVYSGMVGIGVGSSSHPSCIICAGLRVKRSPPYVAFILINSFSGLAGQIRRRGLLRYIRTLRSNSTVDCSCLRWRCWRQICD